MQKIFAWIGGGAVLLAALTALTLIALDWPNRPAPFDRNVALKLVDSYQGTISRDRYGVPHIHGARNVDAAFALAYAHAEDDYATIESVVLATRGTLAERDGAKAAPTDYLIRMMRIWEDLDARYESDFPADVRAVMQAYADGLTSYAARHPDKISPGAAPFTGKDVAAGFAFKTPLFYGFDDKLRQVLEPAPEKGSGKGPDKGSNGVAVAPSRSTDGATRLLVNSHQPFTGPVAWYEAVVEGGEGWHVAGGFFPGSPFMLHGHNRHLGWANTVNAPDLFDAYRLTLAPNDPNAYVLDGKPRAFERRMAKLRVKLWGPFYWTAVREMIWSEHGMAFRAPSGVYAIRYAGQREIRGALQYWQLNMSRNADEWKDALALQALPSNNYIYADETGKIGYVYNGLFPQRAPGADWSGVLPGDRSDLIWRRYMPFENIPQIWNPRSGFVFNSNNTPFQATGPADAPSPDAFAPEMGIQKNMTNRAWRTIETYGADAAISPDEFRAYKYDDAYSPKSAQMGLVQQILAMSFDDPDLKAGQDLMRGWSGRAHRGDRAAALAILSTAAGARAEERGEKVPDLATAYRSSVFELKKDFGRIDPEWSQVMRVRRGKVDLAIDGGPDAFRAIYGERQKDGIYTAIAGDTLIMFVEWDRVGNLSSQSIHQFGSATLDETSPHYADQAPMFAAMQTKPVLFWKEQQAGQMKETYVPGPKGR
jgi:penicillin amidase/acyl-homoserine-lactone acylase